MYVCPIIALSDSEKTQSLIGARHRHWRPHHKSSTILKWTHVKILSSSSSPNLLLRLQSPRAPFVLKLVGSLIGSYLYLQIILSSSRQIFLIRSSSLMGVKHRQFLTWREIPLEDISPHSALMTFSWRTGDPPFIVTKGKDLTTKKGGPYKWQTNICKLVFLSFPYHLDDDPQPAESTRASQRSAPLPPFLFTFSIGTLRSRLSLEKVEKRNSTLLKLNLTTRWREWGSSDIAECGEQQRDLPGQLHQQHHQPLLPHHYLHLPHSNLSSPDVTKTLVRGTYPHLQWWQWNLISTHKTRRTLWTPDLCLWWKGTNKCICCIRLPCAWISKRYHDIDISLHIIPNLNFTTRKHHLLDKYCHT